MSNICISPVRAISIGVATALGLLALSSTASAAALSCVTGSNTVTVDSSNAPYDWTYLDKDNRVNDDIVDNENNQIAGAQENWFSGEFTDGH